jgi:hypothetical protein
MDMSGRGLFLASTPMIALEAAGTALAQGGRAQLVLIADFDLAERLAGLLRRWPDCPFEAIHCLPGRYTEFQRGAGDDRHGGVGDFLRRMRVKRALRRQSLAALRRIDAEFAPDSVWVGNDRKVETQLALHLAAERLGRRPGRYLDDGLYTYLGDYRVRSRFRQGMDRLVKRLFYGRFWQTFSQVGTSPWIAEAWLAYPELALDREACRERRSLPPAWFNGRPFMRLAALAASEFAVDRRGLGECAIVLALPHSNRMRGNPVFAQALAGFIAAARAQGQRVAIKYHPREVDADPAGLLAQGNAVALPRLLPMELLLPLVPRRSVLCGEGSTTLLSVRWLRPDVRVFNLGLGRDHYDQRTHEFFSRQRIPSVHGDLSALVLAR